MIRVPAALIDWFDLRRSLTVIGLVGGGYGFLLWRTARAGGSPTGLLMAAPFVAAVLAPALIGLMVGYLGWVRERVWTPWHGRYHAFDDHQIRVVDGDGQPGFASRDVHAMLGIPERDGLLAAFAAHERWHDDEVGDALSTAGLARLLGKSTDGRTRRFLLWAARDVEKPWHRRRALQAGPPR